MENETSIQNESALSNHKLINPVDDPALLKNVVFKNGLFFKKRLNWSEMSDREVTCNQAVEEIPNNRISTSKYTVLSFLPKNLAFQLMKMANMYFLFIGVMQAIQIISISGGTPVIYLPLTVIILITAIKDLFEDMKRHKSDNEENNRRVSVSRNGSLMETCWKDLKVGEIVKIKKNQFFPADMLIIFSSDSKGVCFIETKNLDGETNLKHKSANKEVQKEIKTEQGIDHANFVLSFEKPNPYLYTFSGTVNLKDGTKIACDNQNFVLRGCSLRNTDFIYGLIAYSGHDTKIMLNSVKSRPKQSKLEKMMSKEIIFVFILQILICMIVSLIYSSSYDSKKSYLGYLEIDQSSSTDNSFAYNLFVRFGNWILIFTNFVPISLLVSLEMVKFIQGILISKDEILKSFPDGEKVAVQSSNLNEELGQVEYIFSDKTGTLTCNLMEFRNLCINRSAFGDDDSADVSSRPKVSNVNFKDNLFFDLMSNPNHRDHITAKKFLEVLSLCHTVIVENKKNEIIYNASSPDELALLNFARFCGYEYQGLDDDNNMVVNILGYSAKYALLHILEFNSSRKRMSVILRDIKGKLFIFSKGADSILLERMNQDNPFIADTWKNLERFAEKGLRTLVLCQREINPKEYENWSRQYHNACTSMIDREKKMSDAQEEIERDLELVGATAIEDKLQDDVGLTIAVLKEAGIKVWVLTGDKIETAINIGFSCCLLSNDLRQIIIDGKSETEIISRINENMEQLDKKLSYALIVSGDALIHALKPAIASTLMELASQCDAVLCCRVSPKQKQEVVSLVRKERPQVTTLAIGDGANDVNMITAAHVGIGIKGVEGQQAARASDYAIGEFKFLRRLLLYHGREAYRRNAILICYNFYKNVILVLPQFWHGIFNFFSGQTLYDSYLYQLFNLFYASMPIVIYAVLDQEYPDSFLDKSPAGYKSGMKGKLFTRKLFWIRWVFLGLVQALIISFFSYFILCQNSANKNGSGYGFWSAGITAFGNCVLIANFKVYIFSCSLSRLSVFFLIGSYLVYIISFVLVAQITSSELNQDFNPLFAGGVYHLTNIIVLAATCGIDLALTRYENFMGQISEKIQPSTLFTKKNVINNESITDQHNNQDQGHQINLVEDNLLDKNARNRKSRHTGFAFSQEELIDQLEAKRFRF